MRAKRSVLIADVPQAHRALAECLPGRHLLYAQTLEDAKLAIFRHRCELIVAGVGFDGGRLFALLEYVRSSEHFRHIPIVCVQVGPSLLPAPLRPALERSLQLLGASALLAIDGLSHGAVVRRLAHAADGHRGLPVGESLQQNRLSATGRL